MRTPIVTLEQNNEFVICKFKVPHIKVSEIDFYIDQYEFKFHATPYFLRLIFSQKLIQDGREKAVYDHETGIMTIFLPKAVVGEHFDDLDMLTKLMQKKPANDQAKTPMIEVLNSSVNNSDQAPSKLLESQEIDFNWEQTMPNDIPNNESNLLGERRYGFNRQYTGVFAPYHDMLASILDHPDPERMSSHDARAARLLDEEERFDLDHYVADFAEQDQLQPYLKYQPDWVKEYKTKKSMSNVVEQQHDDNDRQNVEKEKTASTTDIATQLIQFNEQQKQIMMNLPNKEYLIEAEKVLLLGLVDILFAYAYDVRTTLGESTVESGWTVCKLSTQLSWLEESTTLSDVIRNSLRRSLTFPLYRSWALSCRVLHDVKIILKLGRRAVLRALLDTVYLLQRSDERRILSSIYLEDYCIWIQQLSDNKLKSLTREVFAFEPTKENLFQCCVLEELEAFAQEHLEEQLD